MDIKNAFEHVELDIKSKRERAEMARECKSRNHSVRARESARAKFLDEEADALALVLELAQSAVK